MAAVSSISSNIQPREPSVQRQMKAANDRGGSDGAPGGKACTRDSKKPNSPGDFEVSGASG